LKVTSSDTDDFSTYSLNGTYSLKTRRIGLTQTHELNMDSSTKHTVLIDLICNAKTEQFEGKWYEQRNKIQDKFELKFEKIQQSLAIDGCSDV
jgi:hypothetical protein